MDIVTDVSMCCPIIAQHSEGAHYFHSVVGLVLMNIRHWFGAAQYQFNPWLEMRLVK